ncbi:hypothetical protein I6F26_19260 [Ensifer sp. IC3342]|nr:hypothetical protein [Ensifer sp. BRP08]MCA1448719.1 hypothetical protein [Ensifer sp. IC3342]
MDLHGLAPVSGGFESFDGVFQREGSGQERLHVDPTVVDEATARPNSSWKRKVPFISIGDDHVLRDGDIAAEAELDKDAAWFENLQS